ncbi:MAG: hypothetical protein V2J24_22635 [Pseudomonadales bacterium]|jgi:hypothetical protein|nr:hypothetical protein [Pseudomonadales bacterium]
MLESLASLPVGAWGEVPEIVAIVIALIGLVAARLLKAATLRLGSSLGGVIARSGGGEAVSDRAVRLTASVVFWAAIAMTLLLVLRTLGTGRVVAWLDVPISYLPRLVVGLLIVAAGQVLGVAARNLLSPDGDGIVQPLVPRLVQAAILILAVLTAVQHVGLDVSFVQQLLVLLLALTLGGLSLAFALGARRHVANLVARSATSRFTPGDVIRIDEHEGPIIEIHRSGVDLSTTDGVVTIPAARFEEVPVLRREPGSADGAGP